MLVDFLFNTSTKILILVDIIDDLWKKMNYLWLRRRGTKLISVFGGVWRLAVYPFMNCQTLCHWILKSTYCFSPHKKRTNWLLRSFLGDKFSSTYFQHWSKYGESIWCILLLLSSPSLPILSFTSSFDTTWHNQSCRSGKCFPGSGSDLK